MRKPFTPKVQRVRCDICPASSRRVVRMRGKDGITRDLCPECIATIKRLDAVPVRLGIDTGQPAAV